MMEKIIAMYEENRKNEAAYDAAEAANDQDKMEAERTRHHELCLEARDNGKDLLHASLVHFHERTRQRRDRPERCS